MTSDWLNWRGEMLTETGTRGVPSRVQQASWRQTLSMTCSPSRTISPVSSSSGMKRSGPVNPLPGRSQRTSASMLEAVPVTRSTRGW